VNDGGGNGASCAGIKVRTDTTKLSEMVIANFGDGRNLIREGKMFMLPLESTQRHSPSLYSTHTKCTLELDITRDSHT